MIIFLFFTGMSFLSQARSGELEDISDNITSTPERMAKGKSLYISNCSSCHGPEGKGDGPAAVAFNPKPRNFVSERFNQGSSPAAVFSTLTNGLGSMPSFASLPVSDRMALVHFVLNLSPHKTTDTPETYAKIGLDPQGKPLAGFKTEKVPELPVEFIMERMAVDGNVASLNLKEILQKKTMQDEADKKREEALIPKPIKPNLARGEKLFTYCQICHGSDATGSHLAQAPQLAGQDSDYIVAQLQKFQTGVRGAHPEDVNGLRMRPMSRTLKSEQDVIDVAHYASQLKPVLHPVMVGGDPEKGKSAYMTCLACHGVDAKGVKAMGAPSLRHLQDWYAVSQINNFKTGYRGADPRDTNGAVMRGMAAGVNEQMAKDIVSYINTLK